MQETADQIHFSPEVIAVAAELTQLLGSKKRGCLQVNLDGSGKIRSIHFGESQSIEDLVQRHSAKSA